MSISINQQVFNSPGFSTDLCLSITELDFIRQAIHSQWLTRISDVYPHLAPQFADHGLPNYHQFADSVDHNLLWPKKWRLFSKEIVNTIAEFETIEKLKNEFGSCSISEIVYDNVVQAGEKEVYWRLVRPNVASDVGPLHADQWFHNLVDSGYGMFSPNTKTVKVWIAIYTEPGLNGLMVVPESHSKDWQHTTVMIGGAMKPCLVDAVEPTLVATEPGRLIIFNDKLLHGGAINSGNLTRVSVEITLVLQ